MNKVSDPYGRNHLINKTLFNLSNYLQIKKNQLINMVQQIKLSHFHTCRLAYELAACNGRARFKKVRIRLQMTKYAPCWPML